MNGWMSASQVAGIGYITPLRSMFVTDRSTHGKPLLFFLVAFRRECHLSNQLLINKKSSSTKGQNMALCETTAWNCFTLHATITQFGIFLSAEWFLLCANSKGIYTWHIAMHCSPLFVTASQWKKSSELNWLKSIPTPKECTTFLTWVHDLGFWKREKIYTVLCGYRWKGLEWKKDFAGTGGTKRIEK